MPTVHSVLPSLAPLMPEIILGVGVMLLILYGAWRGERSAESVSIGALVLLLVALSVVLSQPTQGRITTLSGAFVSDTFAKVMKTLVLLGSSATILLAHDYFRRERIERFEFPVLIVLCTIGMMVMVSANDLIALYLGLELQSLAAYVIAAIHRDDVKSTEAGLKYFVLGALSSGMLLYGASLLYGFTGTVSFPGIVSALNENAGFGAMLGIVFVAAGVCFKLAAVPFHMWTPDVYEGSPTPVTAFFASAPKMAAVSMTVRVFIGALPDVTAIWQQIFIFVAIASMALGSFAAIGQRSIKRLMAYSSIANIGYALIGLAAGTEQGISGLVIYMVIYLAMTLGAFAIILSLRRRDVMFESIDDLSGLSRTHPWLAFCLAMMMFSLAGIPPLAGFFAKFYVFAAAIKAGLVTLAVIGVVTSVVGAFYYLRIVKIMYFDEAKEPDERPSRCSRVPSADVAAGSAQEGTAQRGPSAYRLGEAARAGGHRLHVHDRLGSTNTEALERARAGEAGPLWVVTRSQEAGRGRRGNAWASLPGNLAASVLWPVPRVAPEHLAELGFVAGLALVGAIEAACGTLPDWDGADPARSVRLKWPNDVLLGHGKLAGLLLEAETLPGGRRAVVIGFGVNVAAAPEGLPAKPQPTCLAAMGYAGGAETLLEHLSDHLAAQARAWDGGRNFSLVRARWLARAAGLGSEIAVTSGGQILRGLFETIDEGGRLVILGPDDSRRIVTAGEVHFGTAATAA